MAYESFAYYYDRLMQDVDYEVFLKLVHEYVGKDKTILDAGCGTGMISIPLALEGYSVSGCDLSQDMLINLRHKLDKLGISFPIYEANIEEDLPIDSYDCILSFLDVINYIPSDKKALKTVYESLKPGGIFLFDISNVSYFEELIGYHEEDSFDDFSYKWDVEKGKKPNSVIHHLVFQAHGEIFQENHYQVTHEVSYYLKILFKLGFHVETRPAFQGIKTIFVCRK